MDSLLTILGILGPVISIVAGAFARAYAAREDAGIESAGQADGEVSSLATGEGRTAEEIADSVETWRDSWSDFRIC